MLPWLQYWYALTVHARPDQTLSTAVNQFRPKATNSRDNLKTTIAEYIIYTQFYLWVKVHFTHAPTPRKKNIFMVDQLSLSKAGQVN